MRLGRYITSALGCIAIQALAVNTASASHPVTAPPLAGVDTGVDVAAEALAWLTGHLQAIVATAYERVKGTP